MKLKLILSAAAAALFGAGVAYAQQNLVKPNEGPGATPPVAAPAVASAPSASDVLAKPAGPPAASAPNPVAAAPKPAAAPATPSTAAVPPATETESLKKAIDNVKAQIEELRLTVAAIDLKPLVARIEKIESASVTARSPVVDPAIEKALAALRDDIASLREKEKKEVKEVAPAPSIDPPAKKVVEMPPAPPEVIVPPPEKRPIVIGIDTNDDNLPSGWKVIR